MPKLIDDKAANTEAVHAFMEEEFSEENLPSVEDAVEAAEEHRQSLKAFTQSEKRTDKIDELKEHHTKRREKLEQELASFLDKQKQERMALHDRHRTERDTRRSAYLKQTREIKLERHENKPRGLAGFLSRVTGVEQVRHKVRRHQDKKRYDAFVEQKHETRDRQDEERLTHQRAQEMLALDMQRKHCALDHTEKRELQLLRMSFEKQQTMQYRSSYEHMPLLQLELTPPGRKAVPHKAKNRFTSEVGRELWPARNIRTREPAARENTVHEQFTKAARAQEEHNKDTNGSSVSGAKSTPAPRAVRVRRSPLEQPAKLVSKESTRQKHIDIAMREFDHKREKPRPPAKSLSKTSPSAASEPEFGNDQPVGNAGPDPSMEPKVLQRVFSTAAT